MIWSNYMSNYDNNLVVLLGLDLSWLKGLASGRVCYRIPCHGLWWVQRKIELYLYNCHVFVTSCPQLVTEDPKQNRIELAKMVRALDHTVLHSLSTSSRAWEI